MYKKVTLKNGLKILVVSQKGTQAVTTLALVGTGSKYETKRTSGISHFLEHMFFKGTRTKKDKQEIAETLDRIGGIYNAFTAQEYTGYFAKVDRFHFDIALSWVADIFLNSILPEKEIRRERGVIIEEINMHYDNPMDHSQDLWLTLLYGDQPAGWNLAGTKESVSAISRKDLVEYMKNQYVASNTIVCVAGNIDFVSAIRKVKKHFAKIKVSQSKSKAPVIERQTRPEVLMHTRKTDQTHLVLGVRAYPITDPRRYAQNVLGVILGGDDEFSAIYEDTRRDGIGLLYYHRRRAVLRHRIFGDESRGRE